MKETTCDRRTVLRGIGGAILAALGGTANAQVADERPDFGGWLDGVDGGFMDARGTDHVAVVVGAEGNGGDLYAFTPAGLWIDPGTTVEWVWKGEGSHDVVTQEGPAELDSPLTDEPGAHYQYTFEEQGITKYACRPHKALGMKGAVAVGDSVPTTGGTQSETPMSTAPQSEAPKSTTPQSEPGGGDDIGGLHPLSLGGGAVLGAAAVVGWLKYTGSGGAPQRGHGQQRQADHATGHGERNSGGRPGTGGQQQPPARQNQTRRGRADAGRDRGVAGGREDAGQREDVGRGDRQSSRDRR